MADVYFMHMTPPPLCLPLSTPSLWRSLGQHDRSRIVEPSLDDVIGNGDDDHADIHDRGPIHILGCHRGEDGPEVEEIHRGEEEEGGDVDGETVAAQRPSPWR